MSEAELVALDRWGQVAWVDANDIARQHSRYAGDIMLNPVYPDGQSGADLAVDGLRARCFCRPAQQQLTHS